MDQMDFHGLFQQFYDFLKKICFKRKVEGEKAKKKKAL